MLLISVIIKYMEKQEERSKELDMKRITEMPIDIRQTIQSFLLPETRLSLLEEKYNNIKKEMNKWKVDHLRIFLKEVVCNKYEPKCCENYMRQCLPTRPAIYKSCTNKGQYIQEIFKLITLYKSAAPKDYEKYQYFWSTALELFMSILYVHKKVVKPSSEKKYKVNMCIN